MQVSHPASVPVAATCSTPLDRTRTGPHPGACLAQVDGQDKADDIQVPNVDSLVVPYVSRGLVLSLVLVKEGSPCPISPSLSFSYRLFSEIGNTG